MVYIIPLGACFICIIICIFAIYKSNKSPQRIVEEQPDFPQYTQIQSSDQSPYAQPSTAQTKNQTNYEQPQAYIPPTLHQQNILQSMPVQEQ